MLVQHEVHYETGTAPRSLRLIRLQRPYKRRVWVVQNHEVWFQVLENVQAFRCLYIEKKKTTKRIKKIETSTGGWAGLVFGLVWLG